MTAVSKKKDDFDFFSCGDESHMTRAKYSHTLHMYTYLYWSEFQAIRNNVNIPLK